MKYPESKLCPRCRNVYRVEINVTFDKSRSSSDGLQSWCKRCDKRREYDNPQRAWTKFQRTIRAEGIEHLWTRGAYLEMMGTFACDTCGCRISDWAEGHGVDRISSSRGHIPGNCRPCCWGCNHAKRNRSPESFQHEVDGLIKRYGRGRIPWDAVYPQIRHREDTIPDIDGHIIDGQTILFPP